MKKATHYLSAMLLVACFTQPVSAQFQGKITFLNKEYKDDGSEKNQDKFAMYITPERILLQGEDEYDFMGSIKTKGVLVRLDSQDFVILTGDDTALKISKSDITSLMKMLGNGDKVSEVADKGSDIDYERTKESKTIKGYTCQKFIFKDKDKQNQHTEVWMTKDINVNWGMLAEPWSGGADEMVSSFPMDIVFKEHFFPLEVEEYKNDKITSKLVTTGVDKSSDVDEMVQISNGVNVLSFQEYIFQEMSKQQQ